MGFIPDHNKVTIIIESYECFGFPGPVSFVYTVVNIVVCYVCNRIMSKKMYIP